MRFNGSEEDGYKAVMKAVEEITGITVDRYVAVNYNGVRAAVDAIGGVEVNVPIHMKYTDIYDKTPSLYRHQAGTPDNLRR